MKKRFYKAVKNLKKYGMKRRYNLSNDDEHLRGIRKTLDSFSVPFLRQRMSRLQIWLDARFGSRPLLTGAGMHCPMDWPRKTDVNAGQTLDLS